MPEQFTEPAQRVLVAGGTGVVGKHVCHEVVRNLGPEALVVGDHKPERGYAFANTVGPRVREAPQGKEPYAG